MFALIESSHGLFIVLLFWLLMIFWLIFGAVTFGRGEHKFTSIEGASLLVWVLFAILGYAAFGNPFDR